jgi:excisionase family DNA binding protein
VTTVRVAKQELRPFFTPRALAEYLSISERTVRDMLSKQRIPSYKVEGQRRIDPADVEKLRERYDSTRFEFYSPEEVWALVRAAASEQDGAIFLTAAFTGLRRGELIALRWRDVAFERSSIRVSGSYANGQLTTPKSGHGRVVPVVPEVADALARLRQRGELVDEDDLVLSVTSLC